MMKDKSSAWLLPLIALGASHFSAYQFDRHIELRTELLTWLLLLFGLRWKGRQLASTDGQSLTTQGSGRTSSPALWALSLGFATTAVYKAEIGSLGLLVSFICF